MLLWASWLICGWFMCDWSSLEDRGKGEIMAWVYVMAVSGPQSSPCAHSLGSKSHLFPSSPELSFLLFSPRIKGWWVSHHYVSTFLSGVMLTW